MKKILGLDIGVSSVGLAIVKEENGIQKIENLSVRIVPEDPDFHGKFYSGNTASKNEGRTIKRGIRRNNQRFKLRRDNLYKVLKENNMFPTKEQLKISANELYGLRATAVVEKISLQELGRVFILLNQRRGFLSNRKSDLKEENSTEYKERISTLEAELDGKTIGQQLYSELNNATNSFDILLRERTYQRSSYLLEFDRIWDKQKEFHNELSGGPHNKNNKGTLYDLIRNKIIYYQRPLKSQKGLISDCLFEKHHKSVAKSSPYFELFRIWQRINDLSATLSNGNKIYPTKEQKQILFETLFYGSDSLSKFKLNNKYKLTVSEIKKILGLKRNEGYLNFTELDGSRTYCVLKEALEQTKVENYKEYLKFDYSACDEKGGLFELWHITYSLSTEEEVRKTIAKRFEAISEEQAHLIAQMVAYKPDYGSLSTRAIKKLLPHLTEGKGYSEACDVVGYDHSGYKTEIELKEKLKPVKQNSLRNPVVEQILNQVVNMVNLAIDKYGKFDEIRVELARELRNSAKTRNNITTANSRNKKRNDWIRKELKDNYGFKIVNGRDVKRYILWEETNKICLYCQKPINNTDMLNGNADIEHILPKSRSFSNAMNNFILAHRKCNSEKNQMTAYDFIANKEGDALHQYIEQVNRLYKDGKGSISKSKFDNLMCKGEDIPSDFVERMKKDSQYISKEAVKLLKSICVNTHTTTGQITDYLREHWELKSVLMELSYPKYEAIGQIEEKEFKNSQGEIKTYKDIKDWTKRDDHRHHAVDALITALTDQKIIFRLNNLNKIYQFEKDQLTTEEIKDFEEFLGGKLTFKEYLDQVGNVLDCPIKNIRNEAKEHLENIFISFKKDNGKVLTKTINKPKNAQEQVTWVPRKRLHEDTIMGRVKRLAKNKVKLNQKITIEQINNIVSPKIKESVIGYLIQQGGNPTLAFASKNLKKSPLVYKNKELKEVAVYEYIYTKRIDLESFFTDAQRTTNAKNNMLKNIERVNPQIYDSLKMRLSNFNGKYNEAFKNLINDPIRLKNGHYIKSIKIHEEGKTEEIAIKKDCFGNIILDKNGVAIRTNHVKTGGNHHALIFKDKKGNYKDKVVSFWDAVGIGLVNVTETNRPYPIIERKDHPELGKFVFSMQINDLFVFDLKHSENPTEENEIDFFDTANRKLISDKLFRLQKMTKKSKGTFEVRYRHHLESTLNRSELFLKGITWDEQGSNKHLGRLTKVRINHLGQIIKVGE